VTPTILKCPLCGYPLRSTWRGGGDTYSLRLACCNYQCSLYTTSLTLAEAETLGAGRLYRDTLEQIAQQEIEAPPTLAAWQQTIVLALTVLRTGGVR
jgi:hypothetical protein